MSVPRTYTHTHTHTEVCSDRLNIHVFLAESSELRRRKEVSAVTEVTAIWVLAKDVQLLTLYTFTHAQACAHTYTHITHTSNRS